MLRDIIAKRLGNAPDGDSNSIIKITPGERRDLIALAELREKVTKSKLVATGAKLLVELDRQLDTFYHFSSDETWNAVKEAADKAVEEANAKVMARSRELGIPDRFAPSYGGGWASGGEQGVKERLEK